MTNADIAAIAVRLTERMGLFHPHLPVPRPVKLAEVYRLPGAKRESRPPSTSTVTDDPIMIALTRVAEFPSPCL